LSPALTFAKSGKYRWRRHRADRRPLGDGLVVPLCDLDDLIR
jgi:hypothetical protein